MRVAREQHHLDADIRSCDDHIRTLTAKLAVAPDDERADLEAQIAGYNKTKASLVAGDTADDARPDLPAE